MQAKDVMTTRVISVTPETPVAQIAQTLLDNGISAVPVLTASGEVAGIVSEGDLLHRREIDTERRPSWWLRLLGGGESARDYTKVHGMTAADVMTRSVVSATEDTNLNEIAHLLEGHGIKRVPVLRDGRLVGIVSRADLVRGLAVRAQTMANTSVADDRTIRERIDAELRGQSWAAKLMVNPVVEDGVVHLWGFVPTDADRDALRVLAEGIPGVRSVVDHLARRRFVLES